MFTSRPSVSFSASAIGVTSRLRTLNIGLLAISCIAAVHYVGPASAVDRVEPAQPLIVNAASAIPRCGSTGECYNWTVCKCCTLNNVWGVTCHDGSEISCLHGILQDPFVGTPTMANAGYGPVIYGYNQVGWCLYDVAYCTGDPDSPCAFHDDFEGAISCADYLDPGLPWTCP